MQGMVLSLVEVVDRLVLAFSLAVRKSNIDLTLILLRY